MGLGMRCRLAEVRLDVPAPSVNVGGQADEVTNARGGRWRYAPAVESSEVR